jgi:hypothetical protein
MIPVEIRRYILKTLYGFYKEKPFNFVKIADLCNKIEINENDIMWHLEYLSTSGYIEGTANRHFGSSKYLEKVKITNKGVDLLEDPSEFNRKFPDIQINITVENFLVSIQYEIEQADMPEEEKKNLLSKLNEVISHPVVSNILSAALMKIAGVQ